MQALLKAIKKQDDSRFVYLDCGMRDMTNSSLMANALRDQARLLPSAIGWRAVGVALKILKPTSDVSSSLAKFVVDKGISGASGAPKDIYDVFMQEFFPKEQENDLTYVLKTYELLLENASKEGEKPVIIIGAPQ